MRKLLKILGWVVGMLVVVGVALALLLPLVVDPNAYKGRIIAEVKKTTGRDLSISGNIGLSVFPWLGLELHGLSLSNAPGFGPQQFASVQLAKVRVKLIPLLFERTLEADTLQIQGLDLNLAKSKQGKTNWEDLTGAGEGQAPPSQGGSEEASTPGEGLAAFTIGGVAIENARVVWDDQSSGQHYEIKDLDLKTGPFSPGQPVEVHLELALASKQPQLQSELTLNGKLNSKPQQRYLSLDDLRVDVKLTGEGLPKAGLEAQLTTSIYFDQAKGVLEAKEVQLTSEDLDLQASVEGEGLNGQNPSFAGKLRLTDLNPREWMRRFALPEADTADPAVLKRFGMTADYKATPKQVDLKNLVVLLDDTRVKGELDLFDLADPLYSFNLDINQIDLDRYLPKPVEQGQRPAAAAPAAGARGQAEEPLFPVDMLRRLKLDGNLRIDSLTVNKVKIQAIQLKVYSRDGKLQLDQQIGRFYDGMIKGGVDLDVHGATPKLKIDQEATRILIGPLLRDLTDKDKLEGTGGFKVNITTAGQTVSQMKRSLNGNLSFSFLDGAVKGINLAKMIRNAKAQLSGQTVPVTNEPEQTDFSELTGSAVFHNGIMTNKDLLAKSPLLRVDGSGKVNLVNETLDYTVRPVIVNTTKGQGGKELEELKGVPIPIKFDGPWSKPKWKIDLAKVLEEQQKAKLQEKLEKEVDKKLPGLKEKLPEDLKDKLPSSLKGLF